MMRNMQLRRSLCLLITLLIVSCAGPLPTLTATPPTVQELRVKNSGSSAIDDLVVLFPGISSQSAATRIPIGSIPAGGVSAYVAVPSGVYRYAAYEYRLAGQLASQAVVDWIGEQPMPGQRFTYEIHLDSTKPTGGQIEMLQVTVDNP